MTDLLTWLCTVGSFRYPWSRFLPQGAPTSPMLFNLVCVKMDLRIERFVRKIGGTYTRYADNLFVSTDRPLTETERRIICKKVWEAGFELNERKTRLMRVSGHTNLALPGVSISQGRLAISKSDQRRLRADVYHARRKGETERLKGLLSYAAQIYGGKIPKRITG